VEPRKEEEEEARILLNRNKECNEKNFVTKVKILQSRHMQILWEKLVIQPFVIFKGKILYNEFSEVFPSLTDVITKEAQWINDKYYLK
jgi:hypothetical protein